MRCVTHDGFVNGRVKCKKAITQLCTRRSLNDKDVDKADPPPLGEVDHANTTSRETGIDRQNAHGRDLLLLELGEDLVSDVKVAVNVLNILAVFKRLNNAEDLSRGLGVYLYFKVGHKLRIS